MVPVRGLPISLTCGVATLKVKGQCHLKTKGKVTKIAFLLNFYGKILTHGVYSGLRHSSKVKCQGHLKVKFGAIVFIIDTKAFYCRFLALLNAGVTHHLTTILSDID